MVVRGCLIAFGGGNAQFLAGFRYDYFTTKFRDPTLLVAVNFPGETADIRLKVSYPCLACSTCRQAGTAICCSA